MSQVARGSEAGALLCKLAAPSWRGQAPVLPEEGGTRRLSGSRHCPRGDEEAHGDPAVPAVSLYQEPPKSATVVCEVLPRGAREPGRTSGGSPTSSIPPHAANQVLLTPLPTLLISLKSCFIQPGESRRVDSDLGSLPTGLAAAKRLECSSQLGGEPQPQVSVAETPCGSPP